MKNITTKQLSLYSSTVLWLLSLLSLFIFYFFDSKNINKIFIFSFSFLIFIISFLVFNYFIEFFVYRKIKLIYKSIDTVKSPTVNIKNIANISLVKEDVNRWTVGKQQQIEELKKLELYRKEFLGNVSHELKTPVFTIQGYIETLIDGGIKDKKVNKKFLNKAAKNIQRLITIIKDLETISLIEYDRLTINKQVFNLSILLQEIVESLEIQADKNNITLQIKDTCSNDFKVVADREKIGQVLINLINNSIRYGKEGGVTYISCYEIDEKIEIEVSDDGIGVAKEHLPRLFERFYRIDTNRSRKYGGSGLGLSIVKHIIEAHNQTINVRSDLGLGSTFSFTLKKET